MWLLLLAILPVLYVFYNRWSWTHSYWEFRIVSGPHPRPLVGNILPVILASKSMAQLCSEWCQQFAKKPLIGFYVFMRPWLLLNKLDYIHTVLVKEANHFADRKEPRSVTVDSSDKSMFSTTGSTWKAIRSKLTPAFTANKIRNMTDLIQSCSEDALKRIEEKSSKTVQDTELIHPYVMGVVSKLVFGLEGSESSKSTSDFWQNGEKTFSAKCCRFFHELIYFEFPRIASHLKIALVPTEVFSYFKNLLRNSLSQRKAGGSKRNDFVQSLVELKERGQIETESRVDKDDEYLRMDQNKTADTLEICDDLLTSQGIEFLRTGFDSMTSTMTFALFELSNSQRAMEAVVKEIDSVLQQHGRLTYDALKDMKYLEMCLMETLRLHPAMETLYRCASKNYTFDNGMQVEKGTTVVIPVSLVHMDPELYPQPKEFRPERFTDPPPPATFLGFGDGPRNCIAKNLAMVQMKMMLSKLLSSYTVTLSDRTKLPLTIHKRPLLTKINSPVHFQLARRAQ